MNMANAIRSFHFNMILPFSCFPVNGSIIIEVRLNFNGLSLRISPPTMKSGAYSRNIPFKSATRQGTLWYNFPQNTIESTMQVGKPSFFPFTTCFSSFNIFSPDVSANVESISNVYKIVGIRDKRAAIMLFCALPYHYPLFFGLFYFLAPKFKVSSLMAHNSSIIGRKHYQDIF